MNGKGIVVIIVLFTSILGYLGLTPYFSSSFENVVNESFEEGSTGWSMGSGTLTSTIISTDAHTGARCTKVGQLKQTFSIPIPTSDIVSAGFWYKASVACLRWSIFYEDQIAKYTIPAASVWTYYDLMSFITASGTGHYYGAGGAGRKIVAIQFLNEVPLSATALVDDVSIKTVAPPVTQPLTVQISPSAVSVYVGDSVAFTSSVSGGTSPYSYQWYLNDAAVSGATNPTWTYTPTSAGFHRVYLKVTDAAGRSAQTNVVSVTVNAREAVQPPPEYSLQVIVKDQCNNLLPAKVTMDGESKACVDGLTSFRVSLGIRMVTAEVKVKDKSFDASQQITVTADTTIPITITRRFLYRFYVNYTDGTLATGKIIATSSKETLEITVASGYGEGYLLDGVHRLSFEASPKVNVGEITVANDGFFSFIINPETNTVVQSSSTEVPTFSEQSPVTTPEIPWILIPSVYIYTLIGVLAFGFILAAVVALRRKTQ